MYSKIIFLLTIGIFTAQSFSMEPHVPVQPVPSTTFDHPIIPSLKQMTEIYYLKKIIENPNLIEILEKIEQAREENKLSELLQPGELEKIIPQGLPQESKKLIVEIASLSYFNELLKVALLLNCVVTLSENAEYADYPLIATVFDQNVLEIARRELKEYEEVLSQETNQLAQEDLKVQIRGREEAIRLINCIKQRASEVLGRQSLTNLWITFLQYPFIKNKLGSFQANQLLMNSIEILLAQEKFDIIFYWFQQSYKIRKDILKLFMSLINKTPQNFATIFPKYISGLPPLISNENAVILKNKFIDTMMRFVRAIPSEDALHNGLDYLTRAIFLSPYLPIARHFLPILFKKGASPNITIVQPNQPILTAAEYFFGTQLASVFINRPREEVKAYLGFIIFLIENGLDITNLQVDPAQFAAENTILGRAQRNYRVALENNPEFRGLFEGAAKAYQQKKAKETIRLK